MYKTMKVYYNDKPRLVQVPCPLGLLPRPTIIIAACCFTFRGIWAQ